MPSAWAAIWQWLARRHPPATSSAGDEPTGAVAGEPQPPPAPIVAPPPAPSAPPARSPRLSIVGTRQRFLAGPRLRYYESPNQGDAFASGLPDMILMHYTASGTTDGAIATLCDKTAPSRVSAHVVIGRDGQVVQLVPLDTVAWHAGTSTWQGSTNVNSRALGIELVNWGALSGPQTAKWLTWTGKPLPDAEVVWQPAPGGAGWHAYSEPQIAAVIELVRVLAAALPIRWLLGHEQVAPGRKHDPGPAFPWGRVRAACGFAATGERS